MKKISILAVALVAFTLTAMAGEKTKKHSIKLLTDTEVSGVPLKTGEYRLAYTGGSAIFYRDGKEVAKAAARTEEVAKKYERASMVYLSDERTLSEIRLEGTNTKVIIEGATAKAGSGKAPSGTQN